MDPRGQRERTQVHHRQRAQGHALPRIDGQRDRRGQQPPDAGEKRLCRDGGRRRRAEVRADAITQNQDGTYSLRFPRFLRFRGFEVGEKL